MSRFADDGNFKSKNSEMPSMFYRLIQIKNAILGELQKLKPSCGPTLIEAPLVCNSLTSIQEENAKEIPYSEREIPQNAECEICTDLLTAKAVYSCSTCFNLICSFCLIKVRSCPFCRSPGMFADRNYALERFLTTLNLPCKYQRYGCKEYVDRNTRELHEKHCEFSPLRCPHYPGCRWSGDSEQLKEHLKVYHLTRLVQSDRTQMKISRLWSKMKAAGNRKKAYSVIMYCNNLVFVCKITLFHDNIIIAFAQISIYNHKIDQPHFGIGVEVSSCYRTIRGIVPLPAADKVQKISLSPKFLLSPDDYVNDRITISIDIKNLDSLLSE